MEERKFAGPTDNQGRRVDSQKVQTTSSEESSYESGDPYEVKLRSSGDSSSENGSQSPRNLIIVGS